jgi:hypothetical protein
VRVLTAERAAYCRPRKGSCLSSPSSAMWRRLCIVRRSLREILRLLRACTCRSVARPGQAPNPSAAHLLLQRRPRRVSPVPRGLLGEGQHLHAAMRSCWMTTRCHGCSHTLAKPYIIYHTLSVHCNPEFKPLTPDILQGEMLLCVQALLRNWCEQLWINVCLVSLTSC